MVVTKDFFALDDFDEMTIKQARQMFMAVDLIKYQESNSLFHRNHQGHLNSNLKNKYGILKPILLYTVVSFARTNIKKNKTFFRLPNKVINQTLINLGLDPVSDQYIFEIYETFKKEGFINRIQKGNRWYIDVQDRLKYVLKPETNQQILFQYSILIKFFTRHCKIFSNKTKFKHNIIKRILLNIPVKKPNWMKKEMHDEIKDLNSVDPIFSPFYQEKSNPGLRPNENLKLLDQPINEIISDEDLKKLFDD